MRRDHDEPSLELLLKVPWELTADARQRALQVFLPMHDEGRHALEELLYLAPTPEPREVVAAEDQVELHGFWATEELLEGAHRVDRVRGSLAVELEVDEPHPLFSCERSLEQGQAVSPWSEDTIRLVRRSGRGHKEDLLQPGVLSSCACHIEMPSMHRVKRSSHEPHTRSLSGPLVTLVVHAGSTSRET